jgi:probable rRNA maturation factor
MVFNKIKSYNIYNNTSYDLKKEIRCIKKILNYAISKEGISNIYFNIILVDNPTIYDLNKQYRNIDRETDVLSFALGDEKDEPSYTSKNVLGDIYISVDKAIEQSKDYGHSLVRELCFLSIHGLLHLLGYDHIEKEDEKIMFDKQEMILNGKRFTSIQEK